MADNDPAEEQTKSLLIEREERKLKALLEAGHRIIQAFPLNAEMQAIAFQAMAQEITEQPIIR